MEKNKTDCKILAVKHIDEYIKSDDDFGNIDYLEVGPKEFVNFIRYATYVCTDSFHGTIFSISSRIHIGCINKVTIASGVLIAGNVLIEDHFHGDVSSSEADIEPNKRILKSRGEISIGENVWIGENVVIMPGVSIGRGCVIGANSTVTKSIPDYAVAAGSPAKIIRRLKN